MTSTFDHAKRMQLLRSALLLFVISLAISCATTMSPPRGFLASSDGSLNQWLDTRLNVNFAEVRVMNLPLTDAFSGMKMAIARADAPVESLKVTLHASDVTRRQALWLLAQKYGLRIAIEHVHKQPFYISISKFVFSGFIGFGLGDLALYEALPRLGTRLTLLLAQCLAAPVGALVEWLWLGTTLSVAQSIAGLVILAGIAVALAPGNHFHLDRKNLFGGAIFGVLAAIGQGGGAVLSRKAFQLADHAGQSIDGGTAAYQRILGGIGVAAVYFLWARGRGRQGAAGGRVEWSKAWPWVLVNTLGGPVLGVGCYQWALSTTPSGIVLPIVAMLPLAVIPFAWRFEGDRPGIRSVIGGIIAVAGVVALTLVH